MKALAACVAGVLLLTPRALAQERIDLDGLVRFQASGSTGEFAATRADQDLAVDALLEIDVDEDGLVRGLAQSIGLEDTGVSLEARIRVLEALVEHFVRSQAVLMEYRAASAARELAGQPAEGPVFERWRAAQTANGQSAQEALELFKGFEEDLKSAGDGELAQRLRTELGNALLEEEGYELAGRVFERELRRVNDLLRARLEKALKVEVVMTALLSDGSGGQRYVHLDGYDRIVAGSPQPYPRFELAVSDRTRRELHAAEGLAETVEAALDGSLDAKLDAALEAVRTELAKLEETVRSDVLRGELERLVADLRGAGDETLGPVIAQAESTRELLVALETGELPSVPAGGPSAGRAEALLVIAGALEDAVTRLIGTSHDAARALPALADRLEARIGEFPAAIRQGTIDELRATATRLRDAQEVKDVREALAKLRDSFGLGRRLAEAAEEAGSIARSLGAGEDLDTHLDLLEAGERHPGDRLVVRVSVTTPAEQEGAPSRELARATRVFRLRVLGLHLVTRGSLLFADPRNGTLAGQGWEPAPAVSWLAHWGREDSTFWNDVLDPGFGLTISLLDFVDQDDLEVGLSASLTLFNDLLWVGYGRNLQAESDFFYIGLNPLVLGGLWQRGDAVR